VVYPGAEPYLAGWYDSVRSQTDQGFDLWVSLDGLRPEQAVAAIGLDPGARWSIAEAGSSPAHLRSAMLEQLARAYAAVVLVDCDDILEASRIEGARAGLAGADVVGCALRISDSAGRCLGPVLGLEEQQPDWERLLARHNVFGLSNSAYRSEVLRFCLPMPPDVVLTDWLLVLRAWAAGATLRFDPVPRMIYRQHPGNVARVLPPFAGDYVLRATDLVVGHYAQVLSPDSGIPPARQRQVRHARAGVRAFRQAMRRSPARLRRYVEELNRLEPRYVWWWCVANAQLEDVWKD